MVKKSIRFYEDFTIDIKNGLKTQTIRYDWRDIPDEGSIAEAVSTQKEDIFADLEILEVENLDISECVQRDLDGHTNYESVQGMISDMSCYYPSISKDDSVLLISFEIVEWRR